MPRTHALILTLTLPLCAALAACGHKDQPSRARMDAALLIELAADGHVRAGGRAVSLEGLDAYLARLSAREREKPDAPADAEGEIQVPEEEFVDEPIGTGRYASGQNVVVRVEPDASWLHVQLILTVCMEQCLYRTWFEDSSGNRVKVFQPIDAAIEWLPGEPKTRALCVTIDLWHDDNGAVLFRCGKRVAGDVSAVPTWVEGALREHSSGNYVARVGEIRAPATMTFRHVFAVMQALADSPIDRIWLYGTVIPSSETRRSPMLPAPKPRTRRLPYGKGVRAVPYDPDVGVLEDD